MIFNVCDRRSLEGSGLFARGHTHGKESVVRGYHSSWSRRPGCRFAAGSVLIRHERLLFRPCVTRGALPNFFYMLQLLSSTLAPCLVIGLPSKICKLRGISRNILSAGPLKKLLLVDPEQRLPIRGVAQLMWPLPRPTHWRGLLGTAGVGCTTGMPTPPAPAAVRVLCGPIYSIQATS